MDYTKNFEKIDNATKRLTITVTKENFATEYQKALIDYAKKLTINGFRKGKAPTSVVESKLGESIRGEVFQDNIDKIIEEIFSDKEIDEKNAPIDARNLQFENEDELFPIKKDQDLVCKITYSTYPEFKLPEYKGQNIDFTEVNFDEKKQLQDEIDRLVEQNAMIVEKKDKAAAKGDIVTLDIKVSDENGMELTEESREDYVFTIADKTEPFELDKEIVGMKKDEVKTVEKTVDKIKKSYQLSLKKIKVKELPKLDDDFAQDVKEEYKTLDIMKKDLAKQIAEKHEQELKDVKLQALLDEFGKVTKMDVPQELIDRQGDSEWAQFVSNFAQQSQGNYEAAEKYLKQMNFTKESYLSGAAEQLSDKVKVSLILDGITKAEKIVATDEEIAEELKKSEYTDNENKQLIEYIKSQLKGEIEGKKTYDFLLKENTFTAKKPAPAKKIEAKETTAKEPADKDATTEKKPVAKKAPAKKTTTKTTK